MGTGVYKMVDGEVIELTAEENAERISAAEAAEAEWEAGAWLRGRQQEYGGLADQLDEMFHDFDAWKARIQAVKDKYPKP